ncbi:MAG: alternative ribosome rescue factor ArfA [Sodalis sp. (in: enterobacteria)]
MRNKGIIQDNSLAVLVHDRLFPQR